MVFRDMTQRQQAEASLRARVNQQEVVARLGLRALEGGDLQSLMQEVAAQLAETIRTEYVEILELMPDGKTLLLRAGVGWHAGLVGTSTVDAGADSQGGFTLLANEPVIVEDLRTETRFNGSWLLKQHQVVSGMSVVIGGKEGAWGALGADTQQRRSFTMDDIHFLQSLANLLASAISREEVERAEREQRVFGEALRDTAEALTTTLDLGQVLDRILENVGRVVPHDAADIMLVEGDSARLVRYRGYEDYRLTEKLVDLKLPLNNTATLKEMISTGAPLLINETHAYNGWVKLPGMEWLRAYLSVPLIVDGQIKGFLNVSSTSPNFFTPEQKFRLEAFAAQATLAIRSAELYAAAQRNGHEPRAS